MFEIYTLKLGELYLPHGGSMLRDPVHCWLVTDGKVRVLVDSGMPDIKEVERSLNVSGYGGGHESLRKALGEIGLTPDDIDYIIPTHLHFDHACNLDLFPNACVVVQRDEILHAIDSVPSQRIYYRRDIINEVVNRKRPKQVHYIDGDLLLMEGIQILKLPSHTAGMQVPIITTAKGKAALVSDLGDHYRYWYPADPRASKKPMRFMAGSFLTGSIRSEGEFTWCAAMQRVMDNTDIVVPAHDSRIPKKMPDEWFAIPESTDGDIGDHPIPGQE
ncbi:MAG: MBL fold metallo-hydrolase [Porticoccaceae bacterium]|nr:MBL fold metallo-hydrolase [Porticoccaceae bacterium]